MPVTLHLKASNEAKVAVTVNDTNPTTVADLKTAAATALSALHPEQPAVHVDSLRLIFAGRVLKDADTLESYKIQDGHTIHLVKAQQKPAAASASPASAASPSVPATPTNTPASATTPGSSSATNTPPTLPNIFGADPANAAGLPPLGPLGWPGFPGMGAGFGGAGGAGAGGFGGMGGMGGMPDPAMLNQMLQNPMVLESMSQMMQNPQLMDMMLSQSPYASMMTPQMRQHMQAMASDPATLRTMIQTAAAMGPLMNPGAGGLGMPALPGTGLTAPPNPWASTTPSAGAGAGTSPAEAGAIPTTTTPGATATSPTATNPLLGPGGGAGVGMPNPALWGALMQGMNAGGAGGLGGLGGVGAGLGAADSRPPEERFASQIQQLRDMGFYDASENVRALTLAGGSVEAAVEVLLRAPRFG
ncbi:hypothetical protein M427DRAFT_155741 [Gonapodya prolifera JEL478]|uniref:Ubiquitin-domain-containing protein n=1 Tax=Gonapodya prolifera (strain JEL478) TaxID=1344416 RepID=A0A139ADK7_GONPJ|nr:hypothetical protein M427DRAFT_155741 [Gonapodya prolifera JEL478]|eukprot:KXS14857.1 hypothetical protein M427DRAFT_155741 [Gonapodya prolifera JEL478]